MTTTLMVFAGVILIISFAFVMICMGISMIDRDVLDKLQSLKKEKDE